MTEMSNINGLPIEDSNKCKSKRIKSNLTLARCMPLSGMLERAYLTVLQGHSLRMVWTLCQATLVLAMLVHPCSAHSWQTPGCHRVGYEREERISNCVVFNVTLNVCRGFCESYAVPSPINTLKMNPHHLITSRAECCNIRKTIDKTANVKCFDDSGKVVYRTLTYKSAESCSCSICQK